MNKYVVIHVFRGGETAHIVEFPVEPTVTQVVRELPLNYEPSRSETLFIIPVSDEELTAPIQIKWKDGYAEEFDEDAELADDKDDGGEQVRNYLVAHYYSGTDTPVTLYEGPDVVIARGQYTGWIPTLKIGEKVKLWQDGVELESEVR